MGDIGGHSGMGPRIIGMGILEGGLLERNGWLKADNVAVTRPIALPTPFCGTAKACF